MKYYQSLSQIAIHDIMPKADLKDIFKNGKDFKFKEVDYSTPEEVQSIEKLKTEQDKIIRQKDVDWHELSKFRFTI